MDACPCQRTSTPAVTVPGRGTTCTSQATALPFTQEVDGCAPDVDAVVGVGVDLLLHRTPVEAVGPVLHQRLDVVGAESIDLVVVVEVGCEAGGPQARPQVVQYVL